MYHSYRQWVCTHRASGCALCAYVLLFAIIWVGSMHAVCVCACVGVHLLFSAFDWQSSWENEASVPAANGTTGLVATCWLTH